MLHDAIVVGGSFAGLSAATYIARGRRTVAVVDGGLPRNRFAAQSHGFLGQDGRAPGQILAEARAQLGAYPTVQFVTGEAVAVTGQNDDFRVRLADGQELASRRLVLAFGVSDVLPDVPGLAERWGNSVIHCPYCHGYEFSDQPLGVLNTHPRSAHQAQLISQWGPTTFYLNGGNIDETARAELDRRGVVIEEGRVEALLGPGKALAAIQMTDGREQPLAALYIGVPTRLNSAIASQLGCEMEQGPVGEVIQTDNMKITTVPGVYAAGDITRAMHNITFATADGVMAGVSVHASLIF